MFLSAFNLARSKATTVSSIMTHRATAISIGLHVPTPAPTRRACFSSSSSSSSQVKQQTRKLNVNGVDIHCVVTGDDDDDDDQNTTKSTLLCMPGCLGGAEADFALQLRHFASSDLQIVSYDARGYGQSRPPQRDFPMDYYQRDADDAAAIMRELGYERYSVMGFSDGAISAVMHAAAQQATVVEKLIIFGGSAYFTEADTVIWNESRDVSKWPQSDREKHMAVYGEEFQFIWSAAVDAWIALAHRNGGNVCMDEAKSITSPTLVLHGAKDPMVVKDHPEWFAANIPGDGNTKLHVFPHGTHTIQWDCADELNALVHDFVVD